MTLKSRAVAVARQIGYAWRGITEPFRVDRTPAWITLAIVIIGAPILFRRLHRGDFSAADFGTVVLTATLIALVWTAHYTYRSVRQGRQQREQDDLRREFTRMSLTAALGPELDYLQLSLTLVAARIETRGVRFLDRPQLQRALENLDLFPSSTARMLGEFDSVLRQIESQASLYAADHEAAEQAALTHGVGVAGVPALNRNPEWVESIRKIIGGALTMIPILKQMVERN